MRFLILFIAVVAMGGSTQGRVAFEKLTELDYRGTTYYTIRNLSLYECQGWCREEPDCAAASFSFVANPLSPVQETVCLLQNETAASNPSSIPQKAVSLYYMVKLNLRSDNVCNRPWTFERVPNKILRGLDNALIFTSTKEACLAACLNERRFTCRSAEYNYVTLQCHLSEYDRRSVDEFVDLVDAQGVDYFENLCLKSSEACKGNRTYKVPSIGVPEEKVAQHVDVHYYVDKELLANNQQACQRACQIENEFLCRSYLYKGPPDGMIYNCQLFHMDHKTLLDGPNAYLNSERPLLDNGEPVGTYYENVCEKPASTPDAVQSGWPASSAQTQESSTVSSALTGTSGSGSTSGSSTTGSSNKPGSTSGSSTSGSSTSGSSTSGSSTSGSSTSGSSTSGSGSGSTNGSTGSGSSNSGIITGGSSGTGTTTGRPQVTNGGPWPSTSGSGSGLSPSGLPAWGPGTGGGAGANAPTDINCDYTGTCYDVEVNCRDTKIEVLVRTNRPFNGRIYSLGRSETCNVDVINSDTFRLDLSMSGQDCNTQSMGGMFTNTVVLQHHSVVMTKADKIYKIKCTYDMSSRNVSFGMMPIRDPDMISITSAPEAPPPRIRIVDANGREVETVRIGDRLTFRVEIPGDTPYGIFARSCVAMAKDARSTFQIIDDDGCPVDPSIFPRFVPDGTALQSTYEAFRFTESYGVIFQCNVRYCLGPCEPAVCPWGRESYESWGRKKRSVADKDTTERKDDDMMLSQEILVLDFEDENRLTRQPLPTIEIDDVKPSHNRSISITEEISMYSGTCPTKASVLALAVTCALLLLLYICTVFYILMKRFFQPRKCDM